MLSGQDRGRDRGWIQVHHPAGRCGDARSHMGVVSCTSTLIAAAMARAWVVDKCVVNVAGKKLRDLRHNVGSRRPAKCSHAAFEVDRRIELSEFHGCVIGLVGI